MEEEYMQHVMGDTCTNGTSVALSDFGPQTKKSRLALLKKRLESNDETSKQLIYQ
jgi:hypothetical protein